MTQCWLNFFRGSVLSAMLTIAGTPWVQAQDQAQPQLAQLGESLELRTSQKMYWRFGYTRVRPNDRSSDSKDVNGPIIRYGDEFTPGLSPQYAQALALLSSNIRRDHPDDAASQGLGIPTGVSVNAGSAGGLTLSLGYYLDEDRKWAIEAYVLGQPFEASVYGAGRIGGQGADSVNLGEVIRTNMLGPIAYGKYIFGDKADRLRLSAGLGAAYVVFFGTKVSNSLSNYAGGRTTASIKNAFGPGVFLGADWHFNEPWSMSLTMGYLKLRTESTVITQTDPNVIAISPALLQAARDVGSNTLTAVQIINGSKFRTQDLVPGIAQELAFARTGLRNNLGSYQRKISTQLDPLLLTLSIGRDF
jgi:outer membrane protein